jgi:hypothetical protein
MTEQTEDLSYPDLVLFHPEHQCIIYIEQPADMEIVGEVFTALGELGFRLDLPEGTRKISFDILLPEVDRVAN